MRTVDIGRVTNALTKALHFFLSDIDKVNLDAGIGTRMAADQLRPYSTISSQIYLEGLVDLSEYVTRRISTSVRHRQPDYYAKLSFLLQPGMFSNLQPFTRHVNNENRTLVKECSGSPFIEQYSDDCLHSLAALKCKKIEYCTRIMTDLTACRYSLTHQILYGIVARAFSCATHQTSIDQENEQVFRMLEESRAIAKANYPASDQDLFMEQIAFGGLLGWSEFFENDTWSNSIIDWQNPVEGCYGNDTAFKTKKREEMQMYHQCLSPRKIVAIAALSQTIRYLLTRGI